MSVGVLKAQAGHLPAEVEAPVPSADLVKAAAEAGHSARPPAEEAGAFPAAPAAASGVAAAEAAVASEVVAEDLPAAAAVAAAAEAGAKSKTRWSNGVQEYWSVGMKGHRRKPKMNESTYCL
jgi:hypothetical protein